MTAGQCGGFLACRSHGLMVGASCHWQMTAGAIGLGLGLDSADLKTESDMATTVED